MGGAAARRGYAWPMSITDTRTVASIIGGKDREGGQRIESRNPANLDEVVCEAWLGDADAFVDACRAARAAQREWAAVPAPVRGKAIQQIGRLVEENKEALARLVTREIGKPYPESLGEVQEIVDTCDFFLGEGRRLYGQTVPSEMPDKQLFTFRTPVGVAAIITAGNFPVAVPSWYLVPGAPVRQRGRLEAGGVRAGARRRAGRLFLNGGLPGGRAEPRAVRRPERLRGPRARARRGARRQGRLHRLVRRRLADRRAVRAPRAVALPRARAARTRSW